MSKKDVQHAVLCSILLRYSVALQRPFEKVMCWWCEYYRSTVVVVVVKLVGH